MYSSDDVMFQLPNHPTHRSRAALLDGLEAHAVRSPAAEKSELEYAWRSRGHAAKHRTVGLQWTKVQELGSLLQ